MQSTKKNINADKNECVAVNKIPPTIAFTSPQQKTKNIKFISCIVPYATNFFKSVWPHIFREASITPTIVIVINTEVLKFPQRILVNL
jgi:hypothetical protein